MNGALVDAGSENPLQLLETEQQPHHKGSVMDGALMEVVGSENPLKLLETSPNSHKHVVKGAHPY
jgi:hypothetical protein